MAKLSKLFLFFLYVIKAKKRWFRPPKNQYLIFDFCGSDDILKEFPSSDPVAIFHNRGEEINLFVLFLSFFGGGKRGLFRNYIDTYLKNVSPNLVLTFIDNSNYFYEIKRVHENIKTVSVQNGIRDSSFFRQLGDRSLENHHTDYLCLFGSGISQLYSKHIAGKTISIGSIKNNRVPVSGTKNKDLICFISQHREKGEIRIQDRLFSFEDFFTRPDSIVLSSLSKYAEKNNKEVAIIMSGKGSFEKEYFLSLASTNLRFIENSNSDTAYHAVDEAEVVVSLDSTLGYESAIRGNKTAFFPIRSSLLNMEDRKFGWPSVYPDQGKFWCNLPDENHLISVLDHLFSIDHSEWQKELNFSNFEQLMVFDPGNSKFQTLLSEIIN
ncbi:LA_1612 family putative O-antigen biosynthesis protein [Leptospira limi]|uniref:Uncharacterized protein n=1 Tax=Leptospira limi TaxID=2950023 RepID=A0ABT3LZ23_9LEPT|nr:LA_1612 family putative O-antigen biosynthesis protein [Leptospira limi]MCW7462973.1 hypothetical protein [Leptospira limi]